MVDSLLGPKKTSPPLRRRLSNRLARSIMLGSIAVAFSIYWVGRSFDVNWADIEAYLVASIAFVGLFIAAAMLFAGILWVLRKIIRSRRRIREEQ
jgi:apolipoprotein N-acyltransferase